jgi:hypothetical protein
MVLSGVRATGICIALRSAVEAWLCARDISMCESDEVSAMNAIRELNFAPKGEARLPLPDRCSLDVSCFEEPEVQDALAVAIEEILYVVTFSGIELQALDGVTVTSDCRAAAYALQDLPQGQVPLEMNPQPEVMEMARTAAVRREGDLRFHIVLRRGLALSTLSPEPAMQRLALGCIAHEAAHVDHESHLYRMFPDSYGNPLECGNRSRQTFLKAMDVWSEYAACRSSATFRPEAVEEFEGILCRAIEDSFTAAQEQIKAHREGRSASDVFRELQQIFGDVFICAGYLLGHVHGVERNLKDRTARLDKVFQKNPPVQDLITRLERILHELWLQEFVWESIEVFAPIYDLICEMMAQCGLVFARHEGEWRVVMYEDREAVGEARAALRQWTAPSKGQPE